MKKIKKLYNDFIKKYGHEPNYASVEIKWVDDGTTSGAHIIRLWDDYPEGYDEENDRIFHFCSGLNDLCGLFDEGPRSDFVIINVVEFFDEL